MSNVADLTGLTRWQMVRLNRLQLVVYHKPPILYTWKQLIFLKILVLLRQHFTFDQIKKGEWPCEIEDLVNNIDQIPGLVFGYNQKLKIELIPKLEEDGIINLSHAIADLIKDNSEPEIRFCGVCIYNIPAITEDLETVGIERIKKFRCKISFSIRFPHYKIVP